jgi:hypothetical protein
MTMGKSVKVKTLTTSDAKKVIGNIKAVKPVKIDPRLADLAEPRKN